LDSSSGGPKGKKGDRMADKNITDVTDENFKIEILDATVPALVDFWAAWCGPCRAIAPVVEELAGQYEGQVKIGKCNVDENPKIPGQYGIRAIPTLILFKNGTVAEQITGAVSKMTLENAIKKVL
jgi:thioredoxin 1